MIYVILIYLLGYLICFYSTKNWKKEETYAEVFGRFQISFTSWIGIVIWFGIILKDKLRKIKNKKAPKWL